MSSPRPTRLRTWLTTAAAELVVTATLLLLVPGIVSAAPSSLQPDRYSAPLPARPTVVRGFDDPEQRWKPGHRGVDFAASPGAAVLAAGDGVVRFTGEVAGRPVLSIQHPDGVITTYEPVRPDVDVGDRVHRADQIGTLLAGHAGCPAPACLHWGARLGPGRNTRYLDPLALIGAVRVRLKPVR